MLLRYYSALIFLVFIQKIWIGMIFGPIAAFLVELFPTSVRYTSLSAPYHIGNGIFGGVISLVGIMLIKSTGSLFAGLIYPMIGTLICLIVMIFYVPETYKVDIQA
jgi:ATP/ADP translocase